MARLLQINPWLRPGQLYVVATFGWNYTPNGYLKWLEGTKTPNNDAIMYLGTSLLANERGQFLLPGGQIGSFTVNSLLDHNPEKFFKEFNVPKRLI